MHGCATRLQVAKPGLSVVGALTSSNTIRTGEAEIEWHAYFHLLSTTCFLGYAALYEEGMDRYGGGTVPYDTLKSSLLTSVFSLSSAHLQAPPGSLGLAR